MNIRLFPIVLVLLLLGAVMLAVIAIAHAQQPTYTPPPPPLGTLACENGAAPTWQHVLAHFKTKETVLGLDVWMCPETFRALDRE